MVQLSQREIEEKERRDKQDLWAWEGIAEMVERHAKRRLKVLKAKNNASTIDDIETLHKLMKQNAFPYMKLERKVLFRKSDIDKWLESKMIR